jgi:tetratricopeptide (TPR) repeat protein
VKAQGTRRLFGAAAALVAATLLAPGAIPGQPAAALDAYHRGQSLYDQADLTQALAVFQRAYQLDPKPKHGERIGMHYEDYDPAFQIGRVHARLGNFEEASRFFAECAAGGYTERSQNADEYRRWKAVVDRALGAARTRPTAPPAEARPAEPLPARAVPTPLPAAPAPPTPVPPTPIAVSLARPAPSPSARPARPAPVTPSPAPAAAPATKPPAPTSLSATQRPTPAPSVTEAAPASGAAVRTEALAAAVVAAALIAALLFAHSRRRPRRVGKGVVPFGRWAILGLLAEGRFSFVYEARERRGRASVALRIRRRDRPAEETRRFEREVEGLEHARRRGGRLPSPPLLARGFAKAPGGPLEYAALELLHGCTLLELSRDARRRLDPALSLEILREIARALRESREAGLVHDELATDDVFLVEPVPSNAGNPVNVRLFGLCAGNPDPDRDASALAGIATDLFRGRAPSWEQDEWIVRHVPPTLREVLLRARGKEGAPRVTFDEVEKALVASTRGFRRDGPEGGEP